MNTAITQAHFDVLSAVVRALAAALPAAEAAATLAALRTELDRLAPAGDEADAPQAAELGAVLGALAR